ncbi:hypothetical protein HPB52_023531 [Rhipicephalus sanguineus]|uniref:C2H2-type domain-containing protein n=1 Tax=Rhipicephalus sanguineus TaxID=34632 RepID=A0A9D4YR04_RHISA|nr:hypothetical protein HPB52_023531 [Rhipicephalus sanguineus]
MSSASLRDGYRHSFVFTWRTVCCRQAIHRQATGQWSAVAAGQGNGNTSSLPAEACSECGRCFRVRRLLQLHRDSVHRKLRPFLCSYCGHRASSQSSLKMHLRQHTGEKPFACNLCEYRTGDHNSLRRHKMRHSGTKPYKCPHCPYACIQCLVLLALRFLPAPLRHMHTWGKLCSVRPTGERAL